MSADRWRGRGRRTLRVAGASLLFAIASAHGTARAQSVAGPAARSADRTSLRSLVGVAAAEEMLESSDPIERLRGIARLGDIGAPEAVDALLGAAEQGAALLRDARAELAIVRVLAPFAKRDEVRQVLVRAMASPSGDARAASSPLAALTRDTAALALARAEDKRALTTLAAAVLQGGAVGDAAARALLAYPPASLEVFLVGRRALAPSVASFLGDLGDLRAVPRLRAMLAERDVRGSSAAALALAKLGDASAVPVARAWLATKDPARLAVAAEVLARSNAPEAASAIAALLASPGLRSAGVRLALDEARPELAAPLVAALKELPAEDRPLAVAALGRAGGTVAIQKLAALLGDPRLAPDAAFALATMPGDGARDALARALGVASTRRVAERGAIVRGLSLHDAPEGLEGSLDAAVAGADAAERGIAAFGLVALGLREASALAGSKDAAIVAGAARGALARGGDALLAFEPRLVAEALASDVPGAEPPPSAVASGVAWLADPSASGVPTRVLRAWAESSGALAPLAARALPRRDDDVLRPELERLLTGTDPLLRAHVALGLADDPRADAVSLLAGAYAYEPDAGVRRAIVRALGQRSEVQRRAALALAEDLDPDEGVRALARSALAGRDVSPGRDGAGAPRPSVAFVVLAPTSPSEPVGGRAARLVRADGLAIPAVSDADGALLVPGLPAGTASLLLAPASRSGDAPPR